MSSIEDDLTIIKEYFSRTQNESQKICARLGIVGKFFISPSMKEYKYWMSYFSLIQIKIT